MGWQTIGHEWARAMLQRAALTRPSHAYLITGPAQVGKHTLAVDFARALNCTADEAPPLLDPTAVVEKPCGQCRSCRLIAQGRHPDVYSVGRAAGKNDISTEQMSELLGELALKPFMGRYRIALIDPFEETNAFSANKLLKTLEEPEPHVVFVLIATHPDGVLPTIRSRCQPIGLRVLPVAQVEAALREQFGVEAQRARLLARLSDGRIGWAIAAAADAELLSRRDGLLTDWLSAAALGVSGRLELAARLSAKESVGTALEQWLSWWRDLLLIKAQCADAVLNFDYTERLQREAAGLELQEIERYLHAIRRARVQVEQNVNARLALEVLLDMPVSRAGN